MHANERCSKVFIKHCDLSDAWSIQNGLKDPGGISLFNTPRFKALKSRNGLYLPNLIVNHSKLFKDAEPIREHDRMSANAASPVLAGKQLGNHYRLIECIGNGSYSSYYRVNFFLY